MSDEKEIVIGIDLGTTNSCAAYMIHGKVKIIDNFDGNPTTPSVVAFKDREVLVGDVAKRQMSTNPNTVSSVKRLIGTKQTISVLGKQFTPEEISAEILKYIKNYSEKITGETVKKVVITVPAYFNDAQRNATKNAGRLAGLEVLRIINEPTAAALAFGLNNEAGTSQKILVYDLGGGTFDVSVLEIADGTFEVLATAGDNRLGGDDWDEKIVQWLKDKIFAENKIDVTVDKMAIQRLRDAAEKAKIELSFKDEYKFSLPFLIMVPGQLPLNVSATLTRVEFLKMTDDLLQRTILPLNDAIKQSGVKKAELDEILMVGGSTKMPAVREIVAKFIGKPVNTSINPDECVAAGAAIQGAVLQGKVANVLLLDVTPLTLSIETFGGVATPIITRNTTIPVSKSQVFSTAYDNQESVEVKVVQGERPLAIQNKLLGEFVLGDIQNAPKGIPQIEISFIIDADGIIIVSAKDLSTNIETSVTIKDSSGLSDEDLQNMMSDKYANEAEDAKIRHQLEIKNKANEMLSALNEILTNPDIDAELRENFTKTIVEIETSLDGNDFDSLENLVAKLQAFFDSLSEET